MYNTSCVPYVLLMVWHLSSDYVQNRIIVIDTRLKHFILSLQIFISLKYS